LVDEPLRFETVEKYFSTVSKQKTLCSPPYFSAEEVASAEKRTFLVYEK
jgi:hypothetical protein